MSERHDTHETAALVPWYLSGTLEPDELRAVEQHLTTCVACRGEVEEWRRLRSALGTIVETRDAPARDLFASVVSRVEEGDGRAARWWERITTAVLRVVPPRLAPSAALALIVLQFGALAAVGTIAYRATRSPSMSTQTQGGPEARSPLPPGFVRLRVAFRDSAREGEIRALLQRLDARITDGPTTAGFYIVEAPALIGGLPALHALQSGGDVIRFAEQLAPNPG